MNLQTSPISELLSRGGYESWVFDSSDLVVRSEESFLCHSEPLHTGLSAAALLFLLCSFTLPCDLSLTYFFYLGLLAHLLPACQPLDASVGSVSVGFGWLLVRRRVGLVQVWFGPSETGRSGSSSVAQSGFGLSLLQLPKNSRSSPMSGPVHVSGLVQSPVAWRYGPNVRSGSWSGLVQSLVAFLPALGSRWSEDSRLLVRRTVVRYRSGSVQVKLADLIPVARSGEQSGRAGDPEKIRSKGPENSRSGPVQVWYGPSETGRSVSGRLRSFRRSIRLWAVAASAV